MACNINDIDFCSTADKTEDIELYYSDIIQGASVNILVNGVLTNVPDGYYYLEGYIIQTQNGLITNLLNCEAIDPPDIIPEKLYFGGDTFINRFSFKRKHSFFNKTTFRLPNSTDFNYSLVPNVGYPTYFFDTVAKQDNLVVSTLNNVVFPILVPTPAVIANLTKIWKDTFLNANLIKSSSYKFDCFDSVNDINNLQNNTKFMMNPITGIIYTYYYGIPSFIVESDINIDYRDSGEGLANSFYPKQSDLDNWLQEANVPIKIDNAYIYDFSYSKQAKDSFHYLYDNTFRGQKDCKTVHSQRVIYTAQSNTIDNNSYNDSFLVNKALDFYDFSKTGGRLISIEALEGDKVLVRQENISNIFGAYIEINTNQETALISTGTIFSNKPIQYANTTLGYFGSQHKAILHTPFGHITTDAKRGNIFLLANGGQGLEEISNQGLKHWFKDNLPFTIDKYFKDINIDNAYNGIGLILCYDSKFNCFYLTKLDYEPISQDIHYNESLGQFYLESSGIFISLQDRRYFKNKSWTISYNFYTKSWVSWHSFTPNYYIEHQDHFDSGNAQGLWKHNVTNKSYQVYYNKLYPFIVEGIQKPSLQSSIFTDVSYYLDVLRYFDNHDYYSEQDITFNKAVVYNKNANSGLLELEQPGDNLYQKLKYPIKLADRTKIEVKLKENLHSFNQFKNIVKADYLRIPVWLYDANRVNKHLNIVSLDYMKNSINNDYIRGNELKVMFINDKYSNYKMIFKGFLVNGTKSTR